MKNLVNELIDNFASHLLHCLRHDVETDESVLYKEKSNTAAFNINHNELYRFCETNSRKGLKMSLVNAKKAIV